MDKKTGTALRAQVSSVRIYGPNYEALRTNAFRTRRPFNAIINEALTQYFAANPEPPFFGPSEDTLDHTSGNRESQVPA